MCDRSPATQASVSHREELSHGSLTVLIERRERDRSAVLGTDKKLHMSGCRRGLSLHPVFSSIATDTVTGGGKAHRKKCSRCRALPSTVKCVSNPDRERLARYVSSL